MEAPLLRASSAMRQVTRKRGYQLKTKARRILRTDLNRFDLVVAMDHDVLFELAGIHSKPMATVKLLGEFLPAPMSAGSSVGSATAILAGISTGISTGMPIDVPDPMNAPPETCHHVFDLLEMACAAIIEQVSDLPAITKQT